MKLELELSFPLDRYQPPEPPKAEPEPDKGAKPKQAPVDQNKPKGSKPGAQIEEQAVVEKPELTEIDILLASRLLPVVSPDPPFERAVYVFEYKNRDFLKLLQKTLVDINLEGLLISNGTERDIRTRKLTAEERQSKTLDYVGGVELFDKSYRVFLLEGISQSGMKKLEERITKVAANTDKFKIMKDPRILFHERIYSEFDVDVKKVKLRTLLKTLLSYPDTYMPRAVPKDIYETLMQLKRLREKNTVHEVLASDLWPSGKSVIDLERNYGDALNDDDLYGNPLKRKIKRRGHRGNRIDDESQKSDFASEATSVLSMEDLRESQRKEANLSMRNSVREGEGMSSDPNGLRNSQMEKSGFSQELQERGTKGHATGRTMPTVNNSSRLKPKSVEEQGGAHDDSIAFDQKNQGRDAHPRRFPNQKKEKETLCKNI